jgi:hypothetical protein
VVRRAVVDRVAGQPLGGGGNGPFASEWRSSGGLRLQLEAIDRLGGRLVDPAAMTGLKGEECPEGHSHRTYFSWGVVAAAGDGRRDGGQAVEPCPSDGGDNLQLEARMARSPLSGGVQAADASSWRLQAPSQGSGAIPGRRRGSEERSAPTGIPIEVILAGMLMRPRVVVGGAADKRLSPSRPMKAIASNWRPKWPDCLYMEGLGRIRPPAGGIRPLLGATRRSSSECGT